MVYQTVTHVDHGLGGTRECPMWYGQQVVFEASLVRKESATKRYRGSMYTIHRWSDRFEAHWMVGGMEHQDLTGTPVMHGVVLAWLIDFIVRSD